jgi:spore coat protein D
MHCYQPARPIVYPPQYVVRDYYTPRTVPVIQPVVTVNRQNVVDVPQYYVQPLETNVVVNQGFQGYPGFPGRRFL